VLAALMHRRKTGRGMKIDLSQVESTINFVGPSILEASADATEVPRTGNRSRVAAPYNIFPALGNDTWVAISVVNDAQWQALARVMGRAELLDDGRLSTGAGRLAELDMVEEAVSGWTRMRPPGEIVSTLRECGIPVALVASSRDLVEDDPQLAARHYWQHVDHPEVGPTLLSSLPFTIDGERIEMERPPLLGEHTDQVLHDLLGLSAEKMLDLRERGVFS
jgi:benzylsuccinate CoA-transferase BbsF subunit